MNTLIKPFCALRPQHDLASQIAAPPYDVLSSGEARQFAQGNPDSFLHISKPEIDLSPETDPYAHEVYKKGKENFSDLASKCFLNEETPCYYIYRITAGQHQQTGLVAMASVQAYQSNRIRKHELTRPKKEKDRINHILALNANTSPVLLTYRHEELISLDHIFESYVDSSLEPLYQVKMPDGSLHELWQVAAGEDIQTVTTHFNRLPVVYIADGHHRSAAASKVYEELKTPESGYFLAVFFPDSAMKVLGYHRVIKDLNGAAPNEFLEKLTDKFIVTQHENAFLPQKKFSFGLYLTGNWYALDLKSNAYPATPIDSLDVTILNQHILEPLLNITDQRRDPRIDFVGGARGLKELEEKVDSREMMAAFTLYPTQMEELLAVADANELMPPKSTWFEPKLVDGLFCYQF